MAFKSKCVNIIEILAQIAFLFFIFLVPIGITILTMNSVQVGIILISIGCSLGAFALLTWWMSEILNSQALLSLQLEDLNILLNMHFKKTNQILTQALQYQCDRLADIVDGIQNTKQ